MKYTRTNFSITHVETTISRNRIDNKLLIMFNSTYKRIISCLLITYYGNGIPWLLRASVSRYIAKLSYASLNDARHYEINDGKSAFYSSPIIECIANVSKGNNHFASIGGCRTFIRTRCESEEESALS